MKPTNPLVATMREAWKLLTPFDRKVFLATIDIRDMLTQQESVAMLAAEQAAQDLANTKMEAAFLTMSPEGQAAFLAMSPEDQATVRALIDADDTDDDDDATDTGSEASAGDD